MSENRFEKNWNPVRNPVRIPPQTPPAGGKSAEARRIHSPRQIVSPCLVRISIFNHLDFARNSFELCPTNTAKIENRNRKPKYGRHFVPTIFLHPNPISFFGGEGGIRTRGTFSSTPPFQGGAFDRSATSPS